MFKRMRMLGGIVVTMIAMSTGGTVLAGQSALMSCQLSNTSPAPGSSVSCDIVLTDAASVRAYQTRISITRTSGTGTVSVNCPGGVSISTGRGDYIFFGQPNTFPTTNCAALKAASAMLSGGVTVGPTPAYLSTYTLSVSPDAAPGSTFEIAVLPFNGSEGSQLADSSNTAIPFAVSSVCVLTIPTPTLSLHGPSSILCRPSQSSFDVTLNVSDLIDAINGVQALFAYNPSLLSLTSITPGDGNGSPWDSSALVFFEDDNGSVTYVVTLIGSDTAADAVVATLHFNAIAAGSSTIAFSPPAPPYSTKLTRASDSQAITPDTNNSGAIQAANSPTPVVSAAPGIEVCTGTEVTLDAGAGYASYAWSPNGEITRMIDVTTSGLYSVTVTDSNGCSGTDDITITVNSNPTVAIIATPGETVQEGTPVTLDAGTGFTNYFWTPGGATTQTIEVTSSGTYTVDVIDDNGCTGSDSIVITVIPNDPPMLSLQGPSSILCRPSQSLFDVTLEVSELSDAINGVQALFEYNPALLTLVSITPGDGNGSPWDNAALVNFDDDNGNVTYTLALILSDTSADAVVATLHFNAIAAGSSVVAFSPPSPPFETKLTRASDSQTITPDTTDTGTIQAANSPTPIVSALPGETVCSGAIVTLNAGAGYASYLWSPGGAMSQTIDVTTGGNYSVTVTDANGCTGSDSILITVNASPSVTIVATPDEEVCEGTTVTLNAGAGFASYQWSPGGAISQSIQVSTSGIYSVTVFAANGCQASDQIEITVNANPTPTITADPGESACNGSTVTLDAGPGYAEYLWTPGNEITQTIEVTSGGLYSVTVTDDNGCEGTDEITIAFTPGLFPAIVATPGETVCDDTPVTLDAGAGYASYLWSPGGEITQTIQVTDSGNYSVTVTDENDCIGSDSIAITVNSLPSVTITADPGTSICTGGSTTLDAGAGFSSYLWSPGGEETQTIEVSTAGVYSVVVTNGNGCQGTDDIIVTVNPLPTVTISAAPSASICAGGSTTLDAGAGFESYLWSPGGEETQTINVSTGGTYSVVVTNGNGCQGTDDITVTVNPLPTVTISAAPSASICTGGSTTLDAGAGFVSYLWSPGGEETQTINVSTGGTYSVVVTNGNGCQGTDDIIVTVNPLPTVTISAAPSASICTGGSTTLDAGAGFASYLWSPGGEETQTINVSAGGTYSVVVTNGNGCQGTDDIIITVNPLPTVTITASAEDIDCNGAPVTLDAGAGFSTHLWTPGGATTRTIQVFNPGTYSVTVTNAQGCSASDDIEIGSTPPPSCAITMDSSVCQGSMANIASVADAGVGSSYIWAISGGVIESGQGTSSLTFSATTPGTVFLFISISTAQSCTCLGGNSASVVPSRCGDMNNDGQRDGGDIQPFTDAILNPGSLSIGDFCAADMDHDGEIEPLDDVALFVDCLLTQSCNCVP